MHGNHTSRAFKANNAEGYQKDMFYPVYFQNWLDFFYFFYLATMLNVK